MLIKISNKYCTCDYDERDAKLPFNVHLRMLETLRVAVPDAHRSELYRKGLWDGYHKYYTPGRRQFLTGFLPLVLNYLKKWGVTVDAIDIRKNVVEFTDEPVTTFGDITLYDYQQRGLKKTRDKILSIGGEEIPFHRGIIDFAPNAGKTVVLLSFFFNIKMPRILFLTRKFTLFTQTVEFLEKYIPNLGLVFSATQGADQRWKKAQCNFREFTVAMVPTLYQKTKLTAKSKPAQVELSKMVKKELSKINTLLVDECHYSVADNEKKLIQSIDSYITIMVSGTPFSLLGDKAKKLTLIGMGGPTIDTIANAELVELGVSRPVEVHVHLNHSPYSDYPPVGYKEELDLYIHNSEVRCEIIYQEILNFPDKVYLINYNEHEHGNFMYDYLMSRPGYNIPTAVTNGKDKDRHTKIKMFLDGHISVFLVNDIVREGVNMPNVDTIINAKVGMSDISIKQWKGRAARTGSLAESFKIVTFYDVGSYVGKHSEQRLKVHTLEKDEIILHYDPKEVKKLKPYRK